MRMIHVMVNLIMTNMGEPEAIRAIKEGFVKINNTEYKIISQPSGSCTGCYFESVNPCPTKALNICSTGGDILVKRN